MKRQQLFHSFLPSVTAAVLTTQSAWAGTTKVSDVQTTDFYSSPVVLSATNSKTLVTASTNSQVSNLKVDSSPISVPTTELNELNPQLISDKIIADAHGSKCLKYHKKSQAALLLDPSDCSENPAARNLVAQVSVPTSGGNITPASSNIIPVPEQLNHSANPLEFPTKSEEVTLGESQPITLSQALELAKRNNNDLQVSILQLERSKFALRESQATLLPTLGVNGTIANSRSASTSLSYDQQRQTNPLIGDAPSQSSFSGQAQLSYNLYSSGQRKATIRQAEEQVRYQELDVETKSEDIRLNVATAYYNLQQADEQVRITTSSVQNAQASLRDAQALERAGVGTKFDVLRSQVNLANSQQTLITAQGQQQISRRQLATLLNASGIVNVTAADPVQLAGLWNQPLEQSIVQAYQNRPELQQQLAQRNIGEQQRRQALAALGPQISFVASYSLLDVFNDHTSASDGYSVGLQATLNLYDGGSAKAKAAQAKSNIKIAETQFSEQRNQVRFQVEQAYYTQHSNLDNVQTANVALEQAKEALRLARLRFQAGVGTQTDVINSENDLTTAEGNRIKAILDYNRALTQLQRYVTTRALLK